MKKAFSIGTAFENTVTVFEQGTVTLSSMSEEQKDYNDFHSPLQTMFWKQTHFTCIMKTL